MRFIKKSDLIPIDKEFISVRCLVDYISFKKGFNYLCLRYYMGNEIVYEVYESDPNKNSFYFENYETPSYLNKNMFSKYFDMDDIISNIRNKKLEDLGIK